EQAARDGEFEKQQEELARAQTNVTKESRELLQHKDDAVREIARRDADLALREQKISTAAQVLEKNQAQHQRDLVRLDRLHATLEQKQEQLQVRARGIDQRSEQLQRTSREIEEQAKNLDLWHERLHGEEQSLAKRTEEQDAAARQLKQRAAGLESQQVAL